jgi:hypothetical protein
MSANQRLAILSLCGALIAQSVSAVTITTVPVGKLRRVDVEHANQSQDFAAVWISDS